MVLTFGEVLLRLTPPELQRIKQAHSFQIDFGGAEANTAVSLAQFGIPVKHITKLPNHEIGLSCKSELMKYGVDTSGIVMDESNHARMGLYFYEKGASQRPSQVIYDRADSSIAKAQETDFNWDVILNGVSWFHFTGITPAISDNLSNILLTALQKAKEKGITISCDLNYRAKLWSKEKAKEVMTSYMPYIDILFANTGSIYDVFSIGTAYYGKSDDVETAIAVAKQVKDTFETKVIAMTMRKTISASVNEWSALLYDGNCYIAKKYKMDIVDRIGGGDSFAAGYIYSAYKKYTMQQTVEFATAASCLKHSIQGDFNLVSVEEVMALVNGDGNGNIKR
ncbi:sugar kinase [Paludicola sp. MB14-C6]|uniref:sugar kinase n=1 Tax=Paludihabitans sp. MB14-C6 TaxID=3070656 RepID=UPI0027DB658F|nr:sugar kinase [Paludicola sp. MB14-C6]WMJ23259.1 sugar kinase [Paludicola sp. MB14-C6]